MKIVVNFDNCESHAECMKVAPEVFEVRDDGFLYILDEEPGEALHDKVRAAARACPEGAISLQ